MKKFLLAFILLVLGFGGAFYAGKSELPNKTATPQVSPSPFLPTPYPILNRSFTLVVTGYNNGAHIEKTLGSIFSQNYDNYRIIYIDDASDDGSFELARDKIYESGHLAQTTLVRNEERLGHLANLLRAVQTCKDTDIILVVGGDDWLAHEWTLSRLNQYYANPDLWLTWGQYREYPHFSLGNNRKLQRQTPTGPIHLRSFYAALFKRIAEHDLLFQGKFCPASGEIAYMLPMLEMAGEHAGYVDEILYIVNKIAPVKEDQELAARCEKATRGLTAYDPLKSLIFTAQESE